MPKYGELSRHPLRVGGIVPFFVSLWGYADASSREGDGRGRNQAENGNRKDALATSGRWASKERGMPVSDGRVNLKRHRRGSFNPDQENRDQQHYKGRDRMHHDAKRAMIGIGVDRMCKRHMDNR